MINAHTRAWIVVLLLTANFLINFLDKSVIGLSAVSIMSELKLTSTQFGAMNSAFYLLFVPTQLIGGMLADRWSSKSIALAMALLWALAMLVPLALPAAFATLLASRMVLGAGEGPFTPVSIHAIFKWFAPEKRAVPNAVLIMGGPLAMIFMLPWLVRLIDYSGWRAGFLSLGAASLLWAAVWLALAAEGPEQVQRAHVGFSLAAYGRVIRSRTFVGCVLVGFPSSLAMALIFVWLPRFLERGMNVAPAGAAWMLDLAWAIISLGTLLISVITQALLDRGASMRALVGVLASCLLGVGGVVLLLGNLTLRGSVQGSVVAAALAIVVTSNPLLFTALGRMSPVSLRGGVIGIFGACTTCAGLLAPIAMGMAIDHGGSERAGFVLGFNAYAIGAIVCALLAVVLINPEADAARFGREPLPETGVEGGALKSSEVGVR